jgi:hypothetical protein
MVRGMKKHRIEFELIAVVQPTSVDCGGRPTTGHNRLVAVADMVDLIQRELNELFENHAGTDRAQLKQD